MFTDVIEVVTSTEGFTTVLSYRQIAIVLITTLLLAAFWYVVQKTSLGRAQRACEQDRKMAALLGIDVDRTISATFVIGAVICLFSLLAIRKYPISRRTLDELRARSGGGS
jgi:branched-chain amino acid transport system permease protein